MIPQSLLTELGEAREALADVETRLAAGEPVGRAERLQVNTRYAAASNAVEAAQADLRRAEHEAAGLPMTPQIIGGTVTPEEVGE